MSPASEKGPPFRPPRCPPTASPNSGCTAYAYDEADQLVGIDYSEPTTPDVTSITYDANGRRRTMVDGSGTSTWKWDSLYRLTKHISGAGNTMLYDTTWPAW